MEGKEIKKTVLQQANKTWSLITGACKGQATIFSHAMRGKKLKHLLKTKLIEGKNSRRNLQEKILDGLTKWVEVGTLTDAVKGMKD